MYQCNNHNQPCWIPYTASSVLSACILKAFKCAYQHVLVPDTTDNGFVALWSSLQGDNDYFKKLNEIYDNHGGACWKHFPSPYDLRKFAALQSSDAFVENMFTKNFNMKYIDETLCDGPELRKKYEDF